MKPDMDQSPERKERHKVARRYKRLGYEVQENPGPDLLPDFMRGVTPDLVARSQADNVVVEIKQHRALKGSNTLVGIAERVSGHPEWRFELVVLEDASEAPLSDAGFQNVLGAVQTATTNGLSGMACIYAATVLAQTVRDLAKRNRISSWNKSDRSLVAELGFKGILPDDLVERCLSALALRDDLAHAGGNLPGLSDDDVQDLVRSCGMLRDFL